MNDDRLIRYFEMQRERAPERRFWLPLADLYLRGGRPDEARRLLEDGLLRQPDSLPARWVLARLLADQGDDAESLRLLDDVLVGDPGHAGAAELRSRLLDVPGTPDVEEAAAVEEPDPTPEPEPLPEPVVEPVVEVVAEPEPEPEPVAEPETTSPEPTGDGVAALEKEAPVAEEPPRDGPPPEPSAPQGTGEVAKELFVTRTLADIYLAQGHREKALEILRRIRSAHPDRDDVRDQLAGLEAESPDTTAEAVAPAVDLAPERDRENRRRFDAWLDRERGKAEES